MRLDPEETRKYNKMYREKNKEAIKERFKTPEYKEKIKKYKIRRGLRLRTLSRKGVQWAIDKIEELKIKQAEQNRKCREKLKQRRLDVKPI